MEVKPNLSSTGTVSTLVNDVAKQTTSTEEDSKRSGVPNASTHRQRGLRFCVIVFSLLLSSFTPYIEGVSSRISSHNSLRLVYGFINCTPHHRFRFTWNEFHLGWLRISSVFDRVYSSQWWFLSGEPSDTCDVILSIYQITGIWSSICSRRFFGYLCRWECDMRGSNKHGYALRWTR